MTPHIRGPGQRRWRTDALVVCGSSVSCLLACWLTARPGAAVGDTLTALALGRLLATELFRLDRLRLGRWGFQDGLTWVIAAVSGSLLSGLGGVSAGFDLSPRILVVDLFVFAAIGLTADAGLKLHLTRKAVVGYFDLELSGFLGLRFFEQTDQIRNFPQPRCDACGHRRCYS